MTFIFFSVLNLIMVKGLLSLAAKFDGYIRDCNVSLKACVPLFIKSLLKRDPFASIFKTSECEAIFKLKIKNKILAKVS